MNIYDLLARQTSDRPDGIAIADASRTITFAQLDRSSRRLAETLAADGLHRGDAVLVFCPMSVSLYVTLLAIFRLGLVAMFVDPSSGREHIERCCALHPPKAFLGTRRAHLLRLISPRIRRIGIHRFAESIPVDTDGVAVDRRSPVECPPEAPALLTFTTGSTGEPKAAIRSHGFLLAQHQAIVDALVFEPGDIDLTTLPIFVLANLASGVTSVIPDADMRRPGAVDPAPVLRQIQRWRPGRTIASPAFLARLAEHSTARRIPLESFRRVYTGGGPVSPRALDSIAEAAPCATVRGVYGSTEAEPIALVDRSDLGSVERRATRDGEGLLAGRPLHSVEVRVIGDRSREPLDSMTRSRFHSLLMPAGEPGEIVVSGDHVLPGYLHGVGDRETKFSVDGRRWHRTGDAGYVDALGRLWLLGRCGAAIRESAGTLYPFSVEAAAADHAGVDRAALLAHRGRRILFVQVRGRHVDRVRASLEASLAWAALDEIRFASIPVDGRHNAKVDYARLRRSA